MRRQKGEENPLTGKKAAQLMKHPEALAQIAQLEQTQQIMALLRQSGDVQRAAEAAAAGEPAALVKMVEQLLQNKQGAQLVNQIGEEAKKAGLE